MRRAGRLRSVAAAVIAPLLVLAVSGPLWAMSCRMGGVVAAVSCCCPAKKQAPSDEATLQRPTCCELRQVERDAPSSEPAHPILRVEAPANVVVAVTAAMILVPRPAAAAPRAGAPPGAPLIVLKRSFLI